MFIARTIAAVRQWRSEPAGSLAFVPTMGALHEGHLSLMRQAKQHADHVAASIFVNPTQFGPAEDFEQYPRPLERDLALCREQGLAMVFVPEADELYPPHVLPLQMDVPDLSHLLEGEHRPTHFAGVCRVVAKLFTIVQPDVAIFGQKDYQQQAIIRQMVQDLALPVQIITAPTIREPDGLAMSSRNVHLDATQRQHAIGLYKALQQAKQMIETMGETDPQTVEQAMDQVMQAHHLQVDYAAIRHPQTLQPLDAIAPDLTRGVVALVAARLGPVRLIDNMLIG